MNRRDLLKRAFAVGAAGLMLPVVEPVRKVWALDRTMVPVKPVHDFNAHNVVAYETGWFDASMPSFKKGDRIGIEVIPSKPLTEAQLIDNLKEVYRLVGKPYNPKYYYSDVIIDRPELFQVGSIFRIGDERVIVESANPITGFMRASPA